MKEEFFLLYCMTMFVLVTSPFTFLVGFFLLFDINSYLKIEEFLGRKYGITKSGWENKWIEILDKNRESLQLFLLERRHMLGVICLLQSSAVFLINLLLLRRV